jgi:hypothetical protein
VQRAHDTYRVLLLASIEKKKDRVLLTYNIPERIEETHEKSQSGCQTNDQPMDVNRIPPK